MAVPAFLVGIAKMPKSVFAKSLGRKPKVSPSEIVKCWVGIIAQAVSPALAGYVKSISSGVKPPVNQVYTSGRYKGMRYGAWT